MKRTIEENTADGVVYIDGTGIDGFLENAACVTCGATLVYYERYDGIFCPQCNVWTSSRCGDPECCYCHLMPDRPLWRRQVPRGLLT